jgi:thiol:disulfide interchange protein
MMRILRGVVGFMFFHLAFWLRHETAGTAWFGFALALAGLCTLFANTVAPAIRRRLNVDTMLLVTVALVAVAGLVAGLVGSITAGLILTALVNAAAAIGRLAFEAIVQQDAPDANRGRAFARFETQNQLAWVAAGVIPVLLSMSGPVGFYVVGVVGAVGCVLFVRQSPGGRRRLIESRGVRAKGRELPAR